MIGTQFQKILDLVEKNSQPLVVHTSRNQRAVILSYDQYESVMATLEEALDPGARKALKEAQDDIAHGRLYPYKDVFGASRKS